MMQRFFARISRPQKSTRHFLGLPERLAVGGKPTPMPLADLVILLESGEGFFLERYSHDGEFAGDTWHQSLADARHQALEEYSIAEQDWRAIPNGIDDALQYVFSQISTNWQD